MFLCNGTECDLVSILAALIVQIGSTDLAALQSHAAMNSSATQKTWTENGALQDLQKGLAHENVSGSALGGNT